MSTAARQLSETQPSDHMSDRYRINETFEYNKENGPFVEVNNKNGQIGQVLGDYGIQTDFFGYRTKLPLGVAAGPLYNCNYMKAAALDGFTVITWKTFRSVARLAHRNEGEYLGHNIVFIDPAPITHGRLNESLPGALNAPATGAQVSITNSFGMPSATPPEWMPEITEIEQFMSEHDKLAITSVVGTPADGGTLQDLADDYAHTAACAEQAGARIIEINLSCPNVCGKEGSIYKSPENAALIAQTVRDKFARPHTKLLIKVGYGDQAFYESLIAACGAHIDGIVAINTIPMSVTDANGQQALPGGSKSGICGRAILELATEATANLAAAKRALNADNIKVIGCGGVVSAEGFMAHIDAGAEFVMCATAALFHPELPMEVAHHIANNQINTAI